MSELRKEPRIQLSYYLKVHERESLKLLGQVIDITLNGMNMLSAEPLGAGSTKSILIDLPGPIQGKTRLSLQMECRWCKRDVNPGYFSIGCKFDTREPIDTALIAELMDHYEFGLGYSSN